MKRLGRPEFWLPLTLLALVVAGNFLLTQPACVELTLRERTAYGLRPIWQAAFDALSATCGAGLLTYDLHDDYTELGRWVLVGLGLAGALLYLAAARQVVGRLAAGGTWELPSLRTIIIAFLALQVLAILAACASTAFLRGLDRGIDAIWNAIAAFSSLGWLRGVDRLDEGAIFAFLALLGALGWPVWLLAVPAVRQRGIRVRSLLAGVGLYLAFLLLAAGMIAALEVPRGPRRVAPGDDLASQPTMTRYARSLVQATCAAGAGIPTEDLREGSVSDGTKLVLAGLVLVGGFGGSVGGGVKWTVLLWALAAGGAFWGLGPGRSRHELSRRCTLAGVTCLTALLMLTIIVAAGLLLIETWTASSFQTAPTAADALLEAASAVGGGNLSAGLTATVTSANLSRGIRQSVDAYQYGMLWLMLAMFIGRLLPIFILGRYADLRFGDAPARVPPIA